MEVFWVFFFFFYELKGAKVVVFKEMNDLEVVTILTEKQGQIWGEKISRVKLNQTW